MLMLLCCVGLVAAIVISWRDDDTPIPYAGLIAVALSLGLIGEYVDVLAHTPQYQLSLLWDVAIKLWDYWCPYFILFPAGFAVALAYDRWSRPAVFFVLMTLLIYPWYQRPDPVDFDSLEHAVAEQWGFNLYTAAEGYWAGHADRRWTFSNDEFAVIDLLMKEIAAGRITPKTHILHIAHDTSMWTLFQFSILTGIDDDPMEIAYDPGNLYQVGSRVRGLNDLPSVMLTRPPYILEQVPPPASLGDSPDGYELLWKSGGIRPYRRLGLIAAPVHSNFIYGRLLAIVAIIGVILVIRRGRQTGGDASVVRVVTQVSRDHSSMATGGETAMAASRTAEDSAGAGLARLYRARFSSTEIAKKEKVWSILCENFFSRFVNPGDRVLEIAAGYCEFINHIKCGEKYAYDANPDTVAYAAKDVKVVIGDCRNMSELKPEYFDVAFASNFFEHLESKHDMDLVLAQTRDRLRPGRSVAGAPT